MSAFDIFFCDFIHYKLKQALVSFAERFRNDRPSNLREFVSKAGNRKIPKGANTK